jgi:hypothetical protein
MKAAREEVYQWLERCLVGPFSSLDDDQGIRIKPLDLYPCGLLFPPDPEEDEPEADLIGPGDSEALTEDDEDDYGTLDDEPKEEAGKKRRAYYRPPSAIGLTFFVQKGTVLDLSVSAYRYKNESKDQRKDLWKREAVSTDATPYCPLCFSENAETIPLEEMQKAPPPPAEPPCGLDFHQDWRPYRTEDAEGHILTISLINRNRAEEVGLDTYKLLNEHTFFQIKLACRVREGAILPYPLKALRGDDGEAKNLELIYRNRRVYAVGHGLSADWEENPGGTSACFVQTQALPCQIVPLSTTQVDEVDRESLLMHRLSKIDTDPTVFSLLESFVSAYAAWREGLRDQLKTLPPIHQNAAEANLKKISEAVERMRKGIRFLKENENARTAFAAANQVMDRQLRKQKIPEPGWRPFQLAFILLAVESVLNAESRDRTKMDLLWFSTGGGKTEAYLGLIATLLFFRRLEYPTSGGGTAVIMRYTLRMLTAQQFERASKIIAAMEAHRRKNPEKWGRTPFSIGLWVGQNYTPNRLSDVLKTLAGVEAREPIGDKGLVLSKCPACGTELTCGDVACDFERFDCFCPNTGCELHSPERSQPLPVQVVDEALYKEPPSLLLATVDKFARMPWEDRTRAFFGFPDKRPPELIIQDELHLISGEVGSMAGAYEAAIDTLVSNRNTTLKYIASTATISNVQKQARKLYNREAVVFPPSGFDVENSFFAREGPHKRLYIGYLSHNLPRNKSLSPLASALLICPPVFSNDEKLRDAWWTWLVYHGSLKGIGISKNQIYRSFSEYLSRWLGLIEESDNASGGNGELSGVYSNIRSSLRAGVEHKKKKDVTRLIKELVEWRRLHSDSIEITSRRSSAEIQTCLQRLTEPLDVSLALCTNMIATGIDVERLGGMIVNGQPPTTAEYIQASSRVGRGREVPGIVVAHYYRNQARDISHYENFKAYHQSFYRYVEPTSVTPFALATLKRTLPAALVCLLRLSGDFFANEQAGVFNRNQPLNAKLIADFKNRCKRADPEFARYVESIADKAIADWQILTENDPLKLRYQNRQGHRQFRSLLASAEQKRKLNSAFEQSLYAPDSLRSVDNECHIYLAAPGKSDAAGGDRNRTENFPSRR